MPAIEADVFQDFVRSEFEPLPLPERVRRIEEFLRRLQPGGNDVKCAACFDWFFTTVKEAALFKDADPNGQAVYCLEKAMECHVLFRPLQAGSMKFPATQARIIAAVAEYFHPVDRPTCILAFDCLLAIGYASARYPVPFGAPKIMSDLANLPGSDGDTMVVADTMKVIIDTAFSAVQIEYLVARSGSYIPVTPIGGFLAHAHMKKGGFAALCTLVHAKVFAARLNEHLLSSASVDFLAGVALNTCFAFQKAAAALEKRRVGGQIKIGEPWLERDECVYGDVQVAFTKDHEISVFIKPLQWNAPLPDGFTALMGMRAERHIRMFQKTEGAGYTVLIIIKDQDDAEKDFVGRFESSPA